MPARALQCVDLVRADGTPLDGLVPVPRQGEVSANLTIDEQAAVFDAASFEHVDFVFFRRFSDGRSSQVAAYVVDNSDERLDDHALAELHLQLWLHGVAPLVYVAWRSRVDVLACARGPDFWHSDRCRFNPIEKILADAVQTAADINAELNKQARFSGYRLADGTFWDDPRNSALARHEKAAHQSLIQAVVEADTDLGGKNSPVLRRLLLLTVLIKYLEDRRVFPNGWFGRFHRGARSFFEVLRSEDPAKAERLLDFLERKFNGDVFRLPVNSRQKLTNKALRRFADLVEARTLRRQRYLWQQFSFEHLPVEIISHLYQRFVKGGHGTVYTPPFLASLLLDHAMPYERLTGKERVLDPACGSGVFLVGAFRRLINVWRSQNGWQRPGVDTLRRILRQSIFGVEMEPDAVELTAFSLALAVCDALKPEVIWRDLKLDPLRRCNLVEADFFNLVLDRKQGAQTILDEGFDVVVGNPPFESTLTKPGNQLNKSAEKKQPERGPLPDNQVAYLFVEQALKTLRSDAHACVIQPSGLLYNRKTDGFRRQFFRQHQIDAILDFTSIAGLYQANWKTIAVSARSGGPGDDSYVQHSTFRRTVSVRERICFELDHYDRHRVSQQDAEEDPFVWRANLLGGGRLLGMSQRLRRTRTLAEYVEDQRWDYGEGFIVGNRAKIADFLTRKPLMPTSALTTDGIDETRLGVVSETRFERPRREELFMPPLVLIREHASLPIAFWDKGPLAYRDKVIGIHSGRSDLRALRGFFDTFLKRHQTYRFCCTLNGSQELVGRATAILKQDVEALPYPEDPNDLNLSFWEGALRDDVLQYMADYIRLGQNSELLRKEARTEDLRRYSELFCRLLASVYENLQADEPQSLNGLICQPFYFGEAPSAPSPTTDSAQALRELVYHQNHEHLRTVRVLRFYAENSLLIVKPDRLRYWIRSTAIRDADETLVDLRQQGY